MRAIASVSILSLFACSASAGREPPPPARTFTVADSIESSRILSFDAEAVRLSPDRKRYLVAAANGDLRRDGIWVRFFTGGTRSLRAAKPVLAARAFTKALGNIPVTSHNRLSWLSSGEDIAFIWEDERGLRQVMSLNLPAGRMQQLTRHPRDIVQYALDSKSRAVLYTAFAAHDKSESQHMRENGFVVKDTAALPFLSGVVDGWEPSKHIELFLSTGPHQPARQIATPGVHGAGYIGLMEFSPDGRQALISLQPSEAPSEWDRYTEYFMRVSIMPRVRKDGDYSSLTQLYVVDAENASLRPLWNAPRSYNQRVVWSPDGQKVLTGAVFLPAEQSSIAGLKGLAVAEIDLQRGTFEELILPPDADPSEIFQPVSWIGDVVEIKAARNPGKRLLFKKAGIGWKLLPGALKYVQKSRSNAVHIEMHESLNTPSILYAVDVSSGRTQQLLDLNPGLRTAFTLGHVELLHWKAGDGRDWTGRLYFPVGYIRGKRYPLVVQTHGYSRTAFSLIGDEKYPTVFAAQALANKRIAVLQIGSPDETGVVSSWAVSPQEPRIYVSGLDGAIEHLAAVGLVDRTKVGVVGFSRTGWHVEYALTHSAYPIAAALVADNIDSGYLQYLVKPEWASGHASNNGGEPYGEGLENWLEEAPAFLAERIRAPLRLQVNSGGMVYALTQWEMFSRLKRLNRPVELYIIPKIEQGTHNLQNPKQLLASAGGVVDWFDFWLNDGEDPAPAKKPQYENWRKLKTQRDSP